MFKSCRPDFYFSPNARTRPRSWLLSAIFWLYPTGLWCKGRILSIRVLAPGERG